jgi:Ni/Co efflux regulator RcnB
MKQFLAIVALGAVIATPAFASAPNARQQDGTSRLLRSTMTYAYERNNNLNRDFQLGGDRWKTNHKKHVRHSAAKSAQK